MLQRASTPAMLVWLLTFSLAWTFAHVQGMPLVDVFGDALTLTPTNFSLTSNGAWLVEFFSPYCPHCRNFAPTWHKVTERVEPLRYDKDAPYTLARVNCYEWMDLCSEQNAEFFPDAKQYFDGQLDKADILRLTGQDAEKIEQFVKEQQQVYRAKKNGLSSSSMASSVPATMSSAGQTPSASSQNTSSLVTSEAKTLAPLRNLTEFGTAPIETTDQLDAYLGLDVGQGPSFVKCT